MNKKILGGLFCISLAAGAVLWRSCGTVEAASVTLTWSFDYSVDPGCTAALAKNCVTGFEYGTTPDGGATLNKIGTVPNPNPVPTAPTNGITASFKQGPPYGAVVYYARTTALDGNGKIVFSTPVLAQAVTVNPGQPSGFSAAAQ